MNLVYRNESTLFRISWALSAIFWLGLVVGTLGIALVYGLLLFVAYLFAHSGFISYVKGHGVKLSREQLPDLHERLKRCCGTLDIDEVPEAYVLNAHGLLNALATRFLRRHYVVLFSDIIDALESRPSAIDFYIGHELGHIKRGHLRWAWFLAPARVMPLLGAAYSRAREYTCDLHGLACCQEPRDAAFGLAVLAAGERSWDKLDLARYADQSGVTGGFWMSFHELIGDYPWLTKRMKRLIAAGGARDVAFPGRHPFAWFLALFVPRVGGGAGGGIAGAMMAVAMVGVLAAIAIPNFVKFQLRAELAGAGPVVVDVRNRATEYIYDHQQLPPSLEAMGLAPDLSNQTVSEVFVSDTSLVVALREDLKAAVAGKQIVLTPYVEDGELLWDCSTDFGDPALEQEACATDYGMYSAMLAEEARESAGGAASSPWAAPNAEVCSAEYRQTSAWQGLGEAGQDRLREACNAWKLQQLEQQVGAG